jgi:dTMP kinase
MSGRLVVFEGVEGAGKSTQLRRLLARLESAGVPHVSFREPGGTPAGDRIRTLLLHHDAPLAPQTEAALFIASRAELVATAVRPALSEGKHVILDRFMLSTYAYQIHGRGLDEADVRAANRLATAGLVPDLTILLSLPVSAGMARVASRGGADRMERAEPAFHERVAAAFATFATPDWQRAHPECGPIVAVDAEGAEPTVAARVWQAIEKHCPEFVGAGVGARA